MIGKVIFFVKWSFVIIAENGCFWERYAMNFISGGINNIVLEWLTSGCNKSAKDITDKIMLLLNTLTNMFPFSSNNFSNNTI